MEIRFIDPSETRPLRHAVLRPKQTLEDCIYPADDHPDAFHIGGFKDGKLVAVSSFAPNVHADLDEDCAYQLRGMATAGDVRGEGFGKAMVEQARGELRRRGVLGWWCNAREGALPFYLRLGLSVSGERFEIEGIGPHFIMYEKI